ncbi:hypothetical protein O181_083879 [Austropuccinia psidii MF-1]|uniref:Maintenance of telomere capping protein 1 n=1 Tax=Austropuccinia psidii MF-1 TaxID=1389203 RepID=A0A9Q3IM68_9BASI|nr:hypothetical protein [Austropuccinia psidii MF-1]
MADSQKSRPARDQVRSILDDLDSLAPLPASSLTSSSTVIKASGLDPAQNSPKLDQNLYSTKKSTINPPDTSTPPAATAKTEEAQSVLDFLDEITQRSSTPTASIPTKKLNTNPASRSLSRKQSNSSLINQSLDNPNGTRSPRASEKQESRTPALPQSTSAWGWGSVLKQATSTVLNQAMSAAGQVQSVVGDPSKSSELVKNLNSNIQTQLSGQTETAKKWKDGVLNYVKASGIDQLGKDLQATGIKSLTDILNMVAPPILKHEIIDVQLSYDMVGYDGIEDLVYRSLSKIMEQVDGGELILNKGDEEKPRESESANLERDLQAIEGMTEGYKLAAANLDQMIKRVETKKAEATQTSDESTGQSADSVNSLPITHCPVYVRIQPILSRLPVFASFNLPETTAASSNASAGIKVEDEKHLFFLILLKDVKHSLDHTTLTQSMPSSWLEISFEENEWVEDIMVEVIKRGVETIGQQYVNGRLSGISVRNSSNQDGQIEEASAENPKT